MRVHYIIFSVAIATCLRGALSEDDIPTPEKRLISTFQIVRFPNDACTGSNTRNGTCYTSAECSDKGGASSGSCADGFGVCCTFLITSCDESSAENITYWDQTPTVATTAASTCTLKICPVNDNICQLRIDFTTFVITGPSTSTVVEAQRQGNDIPEAGTISIQETNWRGNCLLDSFSVNGRSSANNPPTICGTITGDHMYVDSNMDSCNSLTFHFSALPGPAPAIKTVDSRGLAALASRDWDITVIQYECGAPWAAPPGCTQYFFGPVEGLVTSYNFQAGTGTQLANQDQKICIRRERDYCYACFDRSTTLGAAINFEIGGKLSANNHYTSPGAACGWNCESANYQGMIAEKCGSYDCTIIPGAFTVAIQTTGVFTAAFTAANIQSLATATYQTPAAPQVNGGGTFGAGVTDLNLGLTTKAGTVTEVTICTKHVPFMLQFKSDSAEGQGEGGEFGNAGSTVALGGANAKTNIGFRLDYNLIKCA